MGVDLVVRNATLLTPDGRIGPGAGVAVDDGVIAAVGFDDRLPSADEVVDAGGDFLVPGIVDCHIHNRVPGLEHKEDWTTATAAAAAGGVTTVVGMPNTDPIIDSPDRLRDKLAAGEADAIVDFGTHAVITGGNIDQIDALAAAGATGFKVFLGTTVGGIAPPDDGELLEAMAAVAESGRRLGFHEENDEIVSRWTERFRREGRDTPLDHARSRPVIAEREAVSRTIQFADWTGARVHMFHVSAGSVAEIVAAGKADGVDVTAETCPHYLWFTEAVLGEKGNVAKVQPPLREAAERDRLWEQLGRGIDCIATDHAPHTDEEKGMDDPFGDTWSAASGFVGLETEVAAMLTFVADGRLRPEDWIDLHSRRPAQIWDLYPEKGSLHVGTDADLTLVDPGAEWTLDDRKALHSKSTVTPFEGETFVGRVTGTFVRGDRVYDGETVLGDPGHGRPIGTTAGG